MSVQGELAFFLMLLHLNLLNETCRQCSMGNSHAVFFAVESAESVLQWEKRKHTQSTLM